mmetsp:Transcript_50320/g.89885  ORF Transcript_50320/g.89885 Transcript_50320/m.89885 type:complete len:284 (+) Transcript_50320:520-1371(+)
MSSFSVRFGGGKMNFWMMSLLACKFSALLMMTLTGSVRKERANCCTSLSQVALNISVWRSERSMEIICRIWGSNPKSSIWSASSSTSIVTRSMGTTPVVAKSIRRPGVATTISQPLTSFAPWRYLLAPPSCPPYATPTWTPRGSWNFSNSLSICKTSSRVGARIKQTGPMPIFEGGWAFTCLNTGNPKPRVLPLPVCARPIVSRPDKTIGQATFWIGLGCSKLVRRYSSTLSPNLTSSHSRIGSYSFPSASSTLICSSSMKLATSSQSCGRSGYTRASAEKSF